MEIYSETRGKPWIFCGEKNNYPDLLAELLNTSSKHRAIVLGKVKYIFGEGFKSLDSTNYQIENTHKFLKHANASETLNDVLKKTIFDYKLFRGLALVVEYDA